MTFVKKNFTTLCNRNINIHHTSTKKLSIISDLYKFKQVSKQKSGLKASTFFLHHCLLIGLRTKMGPSIKKRSLRLLRSHVQTAMVNTRSTQRAPDRYVALSLSSMRPTSVCPYIETFAILFYSRLFAFSFSRFEKSCVGCSHILIMLVNI